jgi:hypothetical protein
MAMAQAKAAPTDEINLLLEKVNQSSKGVER